MKKPLQSAANLRVAAIQLSKTDLGSADEARKIVALEKAAITYTESVWTNVRADNLAIELQAERRKNHILQKSVDGIRSLADKLDAENSVFGHLLALELRTYLPTEDI